MSSPQQYQYNYKIAECLNHINKKIQISLVLCASISQFPSQHATITTTTAITTIMREKMGGPRIPQDHKKATAAPLTRNVDKTPTPQYIFTAMIYMVNMAF